MLTMRKIVKTALESDIETLREQKDMLIQEIEKLRQCYKKTQGKIEMKKSDLKNGMVVECRNGKKLMYLNAGRLDGAFINQTYYFNMNNYHDTLEHIFDEDYDIMKIYEADRAFKLKQSCWDRMQLIWQREELREMTLTEIEKELGYSVKIVELREEV